MKDKKEKIKEEKKTKGDKEVTLEAMTFMITGICIGFVLFGYSLTGLSVGIALGISLYMGIYYNAKGKKEKEEKKDEEK